jgi:hypothetical protein
MQLNINKQIDETTNVTIRDVNDEIWRVFKAIGAITGQTNSQVLAMLVEKYLADPSN